MTETYLKCPVRESSAYLCDRKAEYAISGTVLCGYHAGSGGPWKTWLDNLQPARKEGNGVQVNETSTNHI